MVSREELLGSVQPGMKLTKNFFKRICGYEISWPGFATQALDRLEIIAGCSRAREYYNNAVEEADQYCENGIKEAAHWYAKQLQEKWELEEGEELRIQRRMLEILQSRY